MESNVHSNLTGIAVVILAALLCGITMERLRQPALVGYILAGVLLGPSGFAMVENRDQIDVLAEMGVLMLLFIVGMELSLRSFRRLWKLAVITTLAQISASVTVMLILSVLFGWSTELAILLGFVVAVSSTAVAIKILEDIGALRSREGRITVGVLIAQDLAVVPMMLVISALGGDGFDWFAVPKIILSIGFLIGLILFLSTGKKIRLPLMELAAGNHELRPLTAMAFCFCLAALSGLIGLSAAYGAFVAGLIIGNSAERKPMLEVTEPIHSILMMVFFLSIGLLVDFQYMWDNLKTVLTLFLMIAVFKTIMNVSLIRAMRQSWNHSFIAGLLISQIGEFSFLLSVVGVQAGIVGSDESRLIIAVTVLSLSLSPLWVLTARRLTALTSHGVTEAGELLRMVYGPEAEMVAITLDGAMTESQRSKRRLALWLRKIRLRHKRRTTPYIPIKHRAPDPSSTLQTQSLETKPETASKPKKPQSSKSKPKIKSKTKSKKTKAALKKTTRRNPKDA
jgi:CPA2 family monovalent cation:H+ antiporter-2